MIVIDGGTVKTSEEGVVVGLGIVFGSPEEPDQSSQRDFFTEDSFIQTKTSFEIPLYHNHGFPIKKQIGEATMTKTDKGWVAEAKIDLNDELGKQVYKSVKSNQYGFSTGALAHLVEREAKENNTNFLSMWPVGELSLTPRPAERKAVVQAVKSIDDEGIPTFEPIWSTASEEVDGKVVALYNKAGEKIWDAEDSTKDLEDFTKDVSKIEVKYASVYGSTTYEVSTYDSETGTGADIVMYEYGGVDQLVSHLQDVLNKVSAATKGKTEEEILLEQKVEKIVKSMLPVKTDSDEISELKNQLQDAKDELARAEQKVSDSEADLTEANEKIAQLEVLAGAKETIKNYKGK